MSESRAAKVQRNVITSILQNFVNIGINFMARMIFVRILDESYLGINGLFANILSILSLADLGMATVMMYSLYAPIEQRDLKKISSLVSFFRKIYLGIALMVLSAGICLIPFLRFIVNLEKSIPFLEGYYVLALLNVALSYLFVYRTTLISADQKTYVLNKYVMLFKALAFVSQMAALIFFQNYFIYLAAAVIVNFFGNVCQNRAALKLYPYLKEDAPKLEKRERTRIFQDVKAMFLYKIAGTVQSNTDNILVSVFVGTVYVGYYSNYAMVTAQIVTLISLVFNSVKASIGNLVVSNEVSIEEKYFFFRVCELMNFWAVGFCSVCFIALLQDFIAICFGTGFLLNFFAVVAIVLNFYTSNIRQSIWMFRETTGIFQETKHITAVTAVINIVLSLLFGYLWGMTGILMATVLARMLYAWWKEPVILHRSFFKRSAVLYLTAYLKNAVSCFLICMATYVLCEWTSMRNPYLEFASHMLICLILPNIIFLALFWKTEEFQYIKERFLIPIAHKIRK